MTDPFSWMPQPDAARDPFAQAEADQKEMTEDAARRQREFARLFHDVFATGRGPELLELMRECTIELDLMNVSRVIGTEQREVPVNPSEWAYHRNGQNSVVRWIEENLRLARLLESEGSNNV